MTDPQTAAERLRSSCPLCHRPVIVYQESGLNVYEPVDAEAAAPYREATQLLRSLQIATLTREAEYREALDELTSHDEANLGPRSHTGGCACSGTDDGIHTCAGRQEAIVKARALLDRKVGK